MIIFGLNSIKEALKNKQNIEKVYIDFNRAKKEKYKEIINFLENLNIPYQKTKKSYIDKLTKTTKNQGICAIVASDNINIVDGLSLLNSLIKNNSYALALDGITEPQNLGLIIRSLVAFGGEGIFLEKRNSPPINEIVVKTSSGAIFHTKIAKVDSFLDLIEKIKEENINIYALETGGKDIRQEKIKLPAIVFIGSEGKGIRREILEKLENILTIPMTGKIPSLNVACATSILCWEIFKNF